MTASRVATAVDVAVVGATKLCIGLIVWSTGFSALSDDDFSRVVIAQRWAVEPGIDPSGTSWLPLPFWITGAAMMAVDRSLGTARAVSLLLGVVSAILVYAAARLLCEHRRDAYLGALIAAVIPSAAVLGVATVPELPTAALAAVGVASAASRDARHRLLGGGALLLACLSRYEPWFIAAGFALLTLRDGWQRRLRPLPSGRRLSAVAAVLAVAGPLLWMLHNAFSHGDPLHFMARVAAYQRALDGTTDAVWSGAVADLAAYPVQFVRQEPEIVLGLVVLLGVRIHEAQRAGVGVFAAVPSAARRTAFLLGLMIAGLSIATIGGGAPTHHIGRPLVVAWLLSAVFIGAELSRRARELGPRTVAVGLGLCATALVVVALVVRPRVVPAEPFVDRNEQIALGRQVAMVVPADARVLLQVVDYGYFAVLAASGRPESFIIDRSVDPRHGVRGSSFASAEALQARLRQTGARFVVANRVAKPAMTGSPIRKVGRWGLWSVR
jgi:4-amino-4-deoxy-L-arabinose transferase-like glycosyltransferase